MIIADQTHTGYFKIPDTKYYSIVKKKNGRDVVIEIDNYNLVRGFEEVTVPKVTGLYYGSGFDGEEQKYLSSVS